MKKKLLVVGDSFMRPDPDFPGQHWSEMLPEYDVLMYSQSGASNGIIAYQLLQGLKQNPDAVVIGFSEPNRLEVKYNDKWITGSNTYELSGDQKLLMDLYKLHTSYEMLMIKDCSLVRGLLSMLEYKRIPYAWTLNLLFNNLQELPFPSNPTVRELLGDFFHRMTPTNLATYPQWKAIPGFHTDDPIWQQRFAQEVREIL